MAVLYILGNGFDLHYGLKTSYKDMIKILATKSIYNEIGNARELFENYHVTNWNTFEEELSYFDIRDFFYDNLNYPDYLSDHEYDRDSVIWNMREKAKSLNQALNDSISEMVNNANNLISNICGELPFSLAADDALLSFNYTSTFEYLCGVNNIPTLHIHGFAAKDDSLIYGYLKPVMSIIKNTAEDYYIEQQEDAVNQLYANWKKPMQMQKLFSFLYSWINDSSEPYIVSVYGHSMGSVDIPYMDAINQILKPDTWYISYYSADDYSYKKNADWPFKNKTQFFKW